MYKLARGFRANNGMKEHELNGVGVGENSNTLLMIKLPDSRVLRIVSRSLFLAIVLLALPHLGSLLRDSSNALYEPGIHLDTPGLSILPALSRDLVDEGLIKKGHKGLIVPSEVVDLEDDFEFLKDIGVELVVEADLGHKRLIPDEVFDFVFDLSFRGIKSIDRLLKTGGFVVAPLSNDPLDDFQQQANYRIVYLRRFERIVVAMRKASASNVTGNLLMKQISSTMEAKRRALKGLEGAYLEPPRRALRTSSKPRKIKFLPDLLKDSLDHYPRRVFISDDARALDWFYHNYPMRDQEFETYDMEIETNEDESASQEIGVSAWLTENVKQEDYVVMKAEAQVVEEMVKDHSIGLVDELFLECKNQWQDGEDDNINMRAYWQCVALYGKLRDEGIAVHQWWR